MSDYHVIVVGGGWYGIAAVRTYLQLAPKKSILLIDNGSSLGGVWSKERVYPHLYANQPSPLFEYPDWSMKEALGVDDWEDVSGDTIARYIDLYCEKFGIKQKTRLDCQVDKVERDEGGQWMLKVKNVKAGKDAKGEVLTCKKLVMALGFTSVPNMPNLDAKKFTGEVFHMKEFGQRHGAIVADRSIKNITVVGGAKSAWEAAGLFALEGKSVTWLIREDGMGAAPMPRARPDGKTHMMEGKHVRLMGLMAPSPYYADWWLTRLLYGGGNWFGRWFERNFWKLPFSADLKKLDTPTRKILMPTTDSMLFLNAGISMAHPHDEKIFDILDEGKVLKVTRNSIRSAAGKTLTLTDGTTQEADVLILATGWTHPFCTTTPLFSLDLAESLELSVDLSKEPSQHKSHWTSLEQEATKRVHDLYPIFENPPANLNLAVKPARTFSDTHHFRAMVPPKGSASKDRNIVFLSNVHGGQTPVHAAVSGIWLYAYLENELPSAKDAPLSSILEDQDRMEKETAWEQQYYKIRYLDLFQNLQIGAFEGRDIIDRLLLDLGIRPDRHGMLVDKNEWFAGWKAWWRENMGSYACEEYAGIVDEYRELLARR